MPKSHSRKPPGAPKGNLNAIKHGFYSRRFRTGESQQLKSLAEPGLSDEIEMLRLVIRRVIDQIDEIERALQLAIHLLNQEKQQQENHP